MMIDTPESSHHIIEKFYDKSDLDKKSSKVKKRLKLEIKAKKGCNPKGSIYSFRQHINMKHNNKKEMENKKSSILSSWLKRIFSIQTFSLLVAIVGVYFGIKTFLQNEESNISLEIYDPVNRKYINMDGVSIILTIYKPYKEDMESLELIDEKEKCPILLPVFRNISEKSLKNFRCEIKIEDIEYDDNEKNINKNYQVVDVDNDEYDLILKYKYDVFHAQSDLPAPLDSWYCFYDEELITEYSISYDGLSKPMSIYHILLIDDGKIEYTEDQLVEYLETFFYPKLIPTKYKTEKDEYAIVINDDKNDEFSVNKGIIRIRLEYKSEMDKLIEEIAERNKRLKDSIENNELLQVE